MCEQRLEPHPDSSHGSGLFVQHVSWFWVVKKDGVMILFIRVAEFNRTHHPSYVEFYHRILSIGTNSYSDIHQYKEFLIVATFTCIGMATPITACVLSTSLVLGDAGRTGRSGHRGRS